ncbi:MAG: GMC family oxidoreductase N-terminal domain-containing protein [Aestuariivirga sp.]|uniref:GMC family oxidoreductase n=1 Tax=Aestuariivirga sp. TaxID=2650926 RepID=UPI003015CA0F
MDGFDFIVIGGGSAGCTIAARLSEDPDVQVLLLEAGGSDKGMLFQIPAGFAKMTKGVASWGWSTVPQKHMNNRVLWYTQAKILGGGSAINAQIYTRGNADDYDAWERDHGCHGWNYRTLLPYFKRAEGNQRFVNEFHGADGPLGVSMPVAALPIADSFIKAAQQYGIPYNPDFNGSRQEGAGFYQLTQRDGRRSSTSSAYLAPAAGRKNLTVRMGVQVARIVVEKSRAVGVEIMSAGGREVLRAEHEVILTSGAIGSPKLMLQSGIGPADEIRAVGVAPVHDLPGVGRNLHDHLDLFTIAECSGPYSYDAYAKPHLTLWAGLQYLLFKRGPAASSLFETGAFWYSDKSASLPDIQLHFGLGSGIEAGVAKMPNGGITLNAAYMRPKSRGSVRLRSADPADAPLIDPNYWQEPEDLRRGIMGVRIARDILRQPALQPFLAGERVPGPHINTDQELFEHLSQNAKTQHHPVGTCKMGTDEMAVVAPDLRVRGLDGLRICDSSIMPHINSSNTNAPTIMIGERAADIIKGNRL